MFFSYFNIWCEIKGGQESDRPIDIGVAIENLVKVILKFDAGIGFAAPRVLLVTPVPIRSIGNKDLDRMIPDSEARSKELASYYEAVAKRKNIYYVNADSLVEISPMDGIHYSEKGHAAMAVLMKKRLSYISFLFFFIA